MTFKLPVFRFYGQLETVSWVHWAHNIVSLPTFDEIGITEDFLYEKSRLQLTNIFHQNALIDKGSTIYDIKK